jgi:L-ascorbate metabolism protein UlaG (beta-lactamase superfamily)
MEIKYLGHSSFRFKTGAVAIVTDPFNPTMVGLPFPKTQADIVTISHHHEDHDFVEKIEGTEKRPQPLVFDAPGEYEASDVGVVGTSTYHDNVEGKERGKNTIFVFQIEGLLIAHLGDLGHDLSEKQIEDLGPVDILIIPVGGTFTIDADRAAKLTHAIGPSIVIPMHFKQPGMSAQFDVLATAEEFVEKVEIENVTREDKLKVTKDSLPEDTEVVVLSS